MIALLRVVAVAVCVAAWSGTATAGKLAVGNASAEPDLADEAGAVTLLVRSGLLGDDRVLIDAPAGITVGAALVMLEKAGAEQAVLMDLGRDGMKLRLTVVVVGTKLAPAIKVVRAGDGDVLALAREAVEHVAGTLKLAKTRVPDVSLGRLRPFATALRLRATDKPGAAKALADANPSVTLAVPAIGTLLAGVPAGAGDATAGVIAARAIHDTAYLDKIGAETTEVGMSARAVAAIAKTDTALARTELGATPPKTALVGLITAILDELAGDRKKLQQQIVQGLAGDQARAVLAFAATIGAFDKPTHAQLVAAAEQVAPNAPGLTSLIGLAAAEDGVEVPRALALVSARELDELELKRLEPLVKGNDATSIRLRAELALRRGDADKSTVSIGTFASEVPDDPRSARYQGWLLASKGKYVDAAKAFEKAGARRELARALDAAKNPKGALAAVDGKPTTAEELALLAQVALAEGRLAEAEKWLLSAEQTAPVNPSVQIAIARLGFKQNDKQRTRLAQLLAGIEGDISTEPAPVIIAGSAAHKSPGGAPDKVVIDLTAADPRTLEPMLEALTLSQYAKSKIVLAELEWSPSLFSMRTTHPEIVRESLVKLLSAPPYEMQVIVETKTFSGKAVPLQDLVDVTGELDGALVYRVEAVGSNARITLLHFMKSATQATQVARDIAMPDVVTFNTSKLVVISGAVLALVLFGVFWFTRSMGKVEVRISRTTDADEALCVEISKNPKRPPITDMLAFHNATKSAGSITKRRMATLISSGLTLRVPTGTWYVHLYGTYSHGGKFRLVPDSCTKEVEIKRGTTIEVEFDLIAKAADVTVEVVYEPIKDIIVWANNETARRRPDSEGKVDLQLPVGHHVIHIQTPTTTLDMELHISSAKSIRMAVNVARELRLMKDLELGVDTEKAGELELVLSQGPRTPMPFAAAADPSVAVAKTQAVSADAMSAGSAQAAGKNRHPRAGTPIPGEMLLDRYRITSELGRGAMGIVQRAWDEKLEREVAIKLMADDLRAIPEAMQLFTQEAKALAQLNHTNIVGMYDQITDTDKVYMIMEFVDGQTLEQVIASRGALPWFEAAGILDQVCAGLAYAHARKVIHRDIKPANIFLSTDKTVKLGDFGLARVMREVTIRRTEVRGTPLYMAPEQITGTDVDHRSDLYAIGCTMFELVCGRPPFIDGDILYAQMHSPPPAPSTLTPDLPRGADELILSLIAKNPDDRPGSANEVRTTLRDLSTM
ncbi:MAG: protein kinase [Myxococcota bacterium]|nr:protein kinase [Myxococcota bacterium]